MGLPGYLRVTTPSQTEPAPGPVRPVGTMCFLWTGAGGLHSTGDHTRVFGQRLPQEVVTTSLRTVRASVPKAVLDSIQLSYNTVIALIQLMQRCPVPDLPCVVGSTIWRI